MAQIDLDALARYQESALITANVYPEDDLQILSYTPKAQALGAWDDLTEMCRGLVTRLDGTIVSRPFRKFHHWTQIALPEQAPRVYEKLDGSLIVVSREVVSSRTSLTSPHATEARQMLAGFPPERGYTYCFELIHPAFPIVCNYGDRRELVLLAKINTETGEDLDIDDAFEWDGALARQLHLPWPFDPEQHAQENHEGFVLVWDSGLRAKVKFAEYVRLHGLMTGVSSVDIWETLAAGGDLEQLRRDVPDEFLQWLTEQESDILGGYIDTEQYAREKFRELAPLHADRKAFALAIADNPYKAVLFRMLSGQDYSSVIWKMVKPERALPFWRRFDAAA